MPLFMLLLAIYVGLSKPIKIEVRLAIFCVLLLLIPIAGDLINIVFRSVSSWSGIETNLRNLLLVYPLMIAVAIRRDLSVFFHYSLVVILCLTALFCSAQLLGLYALASSHFDGVRSGLWWNPIPFSNAVVFLTAACFASHIVLIRSQKIEGLFAHFSLALAVMSSLLIVILSGTRGSLLGLILLVMIFIIVILLNPNVSKKYRLLLTAASVFFILVASYTMKEKFFLAFDEAVNHFVSGADYTAISIRFSAWSFSIDAFLSNVLFGLGVEGAQSYKEALIAEGIYPAYLINYHAHSDVLDAMQRSGIIGLVGLFILYLSPLIMAAFFRCRATAFYPLLFVTFSAFSVGLTDTPLRNTISTNAFFLAFFVVLFICLRNADVREKS